jgi:hypothetical protein
MYNVVVARETGTVIHLSRTGGWGGRADVWHQGARIKRRPPERWHDKTGMQSAADRHDVAGGATAYVPGGCYCTPVLHHADDILTYTAQHRYQQPHQEDTPSVILLMLKPSSAAPALRLPLALLPPNNCGITQGWHFKQHGSKVESGDKVRNMCITKYACVVVTHLLAQIARCMFCEVCHLLNPHCRFVNHQTMSDSQQAGQQSQRPLRVLWHPPCDQHPQVPSELHTLCHQARLPACCLCT